MKRGIIISVAIVVVLGLIVFLATHESVDLPTAESAPARLVRMSLPAGLPAMFTADGSGNANDQYRRILEYFVRNTADVKRENPVPAKSDELVGLLIGAMRTPEVSQPFLENVLPMKPGATSPLSEAISLVPQVALIRVGELWRAGKQERAIEATKAVWAFGQRTFENCVRFDHRYNGLTAMMTAGDTLAQFGEEQASAVKPWIEPLNKLERAWGQKIQVVRATTPKVGDLLNFARHDEDPTFRVDATLWLGVAKFRPGTGANGRAIQEAIEEAKNSTDPTIAKAGQAADAFSKEERRKIR